MTNKNILIVDDDQDFLIQLEIILGSAGFTTQKASSRKEAENYINNYDFDAIIVDLMLEENDDGFVLSYLAKKKNPNTPVMLITGVTHETGIEFNASTDEEKSWIKADTMLSKPIRGEQVLGEIKKFFKE